MMNNTVDIFKCLTNEELDLSKQLELIISNEIISNGGVIPFSRYMELALYYPKLGYYTNRLFKFGEQGDFVTAPLISNLFGCLIARQITELFSFGVTRNILEFGAGNGKLVCDILQSIGSDIDRYYILELSAHLKSCQYQTIMSKVPEYLNKVVWLDNLPESFDGIIFANEVLDAQPCDLINYLDGKINGVGVTYSDGKFSYQECQTSQLASDIIAELPFDYHDYLTEVHVTNKLFMQTIANVLNHGAVILIDYGSGMTEYYHPQKVRGSLRGFFRQNVLDSVLIYPGLIDITTSVNFSLIAKAGLTNGLELIGYTTQGNFLLNCGLIDIMAQLHATLTSTDYLRISNQVNKLVATNEMGELFKVIGFSKGLTQSEWIGFNSKDRSYLL